MEQQEKQAIRSQRLRRAVTCMKRKDREDGEGGEDAEDSEDESPTPTPSKSRRGKAAATRQGERGERRTEVGGGGGFLGSQDIVEPFKEPVMDVSLADQQPVPVTTPPSSASQPQKSRRRRSSSSSSEEDSYGSKGVAMVTARSIFTSGRGGISKRARQRGGVRGKGKGRGKKL